MKPAMYSGFDYSLDFSKSLTLIRDAGFEITALGAWAAHSGHDTAEGRRRIQKLLTENKLSLCSVHAPSPAGDRLFSLDAEERANALRACRTAIDTARELDGKTVVLHLGKCDAGLTDEECCRRIEAGRQSVAELAEYSASCNIKLALENGQSAEYDIVLACFLDEFKAEHIGFCYDSGHENVKGSGFNMLRAFGQRLFVTHIHDNTGVDSHTLPFEGNIDWEKFKSVFHSLNYAGDFLLEADMKNSEFKEHSVFLAQAMQRAKQLLK